MDIPEPRRTSVAPVAWTVALLLLISVAGMSPASAIETRSFTKTFPADAAVRLANLAGAVSLTPGSGGEIRVEATVHAEGGSAAETRKLLDGMRWKESRDVLGKPGWALSYPIGDFSGFAYPGRGLNSSSGWLSWLGSSSNSTIRFEGERVKVSSSRGRSMPILYVDLEISIPAGAELVLRNGVGGVQGGELSGDLVIDTGSGDVRLGSFDGKLLVDTGSGDVDLGTIRGPLTVDTGSGDVEVAALAGNGNVDTGSGSIRLHDVESEALVLDTGSGDIEVLGGWAEAVEADTGSGDIRFDGVDVVRFLADTGTGDVDLRGSLARAETVTIDTGNGDVTIHGGPAASFEVTTDLGSGELTVRYDNAQLRRRGREVVGALVGDGRTRVHVDTGSGDCVISPGG